MLFRVTCLLSFYFVACRATSQNKLAQRINSLHNIVESMQAELDKQHISELVNLTKMASRMDSLQTIVEGLQAEEVKQQQQISEFGNLTKLASRMDSLQKIVEGLQAEEVKQRQRISEFQEQVKQQQEPIIDLQERLEQIDGGKGVAFLAEVKSILRGLGHNQRIVFGTVRTNEGGAYSGNTGVFTCPVSGLYLFSATVLTARGERVESELILSKANKRQSIVGKLYSGASSRSRYGSGSKTVTLRLDIEDQVWVRVSLGSVVWHLWSSFSGVLLQGS